MRVMTPTPEDSLRRRSVVGRVQDTLDPGPGRSIPQNRCSFPFDRATHPAKKGAAVRPLN
jgi:hypothetical protein